MMNPKTQKETQKIRCPVCSSHAGDYFLAIGNHKIYKCIQCGLEYTHPMPSDVELLNFYSNYIDIRAVTEVVRMNAIRNLEYLKNFDYDSAKKILDFGAGKGHFVDIAGPNCLGLDFNGIRSARCYSSAHDLPITEFDFITLWGVLEHLNNPHKTLAEIKKLLKHRGFLVITTVNAEGNIPYYYKPIEHLTYWTSEACRHLFKDLGLDLIEFKPYEMIQNTGVYLDRLLSRTPNEYRNLFIRDSQCLPDYVVVPTNEVLIVGRAI